MNYFSRSRLLLKLLTEFTRKFIELIFFLKKKYLKIYGRIYNNTNYFIFLCFPNCGSKQKQSTAVIYMHGILRQIMWTIKSRDSFKHSKHNLLSNELHYHYFFLFPPAVGFRAKFSYSRFNGPIALAVPKYLNQLFFPPKKDII